MKKTISVIIPVYNVENYLRECLDSVINQTLNDIEIICVNDGSTDNSYDILLEYYEKYDNIKLISQKNMGLSTARNEGLKIATGKYVYFVDSDDLLAENALEKIWKECEEKNLDVLFFSFKNISESELMKERYSKHFLNTKRTAVIENVVDGIELLDFFCKNKEYYVNVWLQVLKREFILEKNILFYDGLIYEDNLYTFDVLINAERSYCINDILYLKRIRENSIVTGKQNSESARGFLVTIIEILERAKKIKGFSHDIDENIMYILDGLIQRMNKYFNQLDLSDQEVFLNNCTLNESIVFKLLSR